MKKTRRITIAPKKGLLDVPKELQSKFAVAAAELLILEGRRAEVLSIISGLTASDLVKKQVAISPVKTKTKSATVPLEPPVPDQTYSSEKYKVMLQDPNSMPSIMLSVVKKFDEINWDDLLHTLRTEYDDSSNDSSLEDALEMLSEERLVSIDGTGNKKSIIIRHWVPQPYCM